MKIIRLRAIESRSRCCLEKNRKLLNDVILQTNVPRDVWRFDVIFIRPQIKYDVGDDVSQYLRRCEESVT